MNSKNSTSQQIRQEFLSYFKNQGHAIVPSSSLIPEQDPTLLFTNAGMNQFKNLFLGNETRGYSRATSSQKCVRAGGKHNDLENVGFTARHHTFFEMLGNFSFGDYFKKEAIHFAWELLTKNLQIPADKLYVTVFETDDEAAEIWHRQEGVPRERIFRFGEKDNFWRMGETGPCGPCSEIFYDHGPHAGSISDPFQGIASGQDRFVEIWNLVFMQYNENPPGQMKPLPKPSVDTGSGLERVVAALQGKLNNYDTDLFWPLISRSAELSKKTHLLELIEEKNRKGLQLTLKPQDQADVAALRVIADHIRSASLLIADGAIPSAEGRGYVLRRILRRAIRFSQKVSGRAGQPGSSFIPQIAEVFITLMKGVFPELETRKELILSTLNDEQDRFVHTLSTGTEILESEFAQLKSKSATMLSGEVAFKMYDTFGFPLDLTQLMAQENHLSVDTQGFDRALQNSRELSREKNKTHFKSGKVQAELQEIAQKIKAEIGPTRFLGYEQLQAESPILGLIIDGKLASEIRDGGYVISQETPFYSEGGGQAADHGTLTTDTGEALILDCQKVSDIVFHLIQVKNGFIKTIQKSKLQVDHPERRMTAANHSATHLLHAALRKVLGTPSQPVTQAGSLVDAEKLRFDFTYSKPVTKEHLEQVENLVNQEILKSHEVKPQTMPYQKAIENGALALFGEKYTDQVRVLRMGDFSCELCGGTHVANTSQIQMFKITLEIGVSAGVRRIEALTSTKAFDFLNQNAKENLHAREEAGLIGNSLSVANWIQNKKLEIKSFEKEILKLKVSQISVDEILSKAVDIEFKTKKIKFAGAEVAISDREALGLVSEQLKNKISSGVSVLVGSPFEGGLSAVVITVSKDLNPNVAAGALLKEVVAATGGKGGGKPDSAQGTTTNPKLLIELIQKMLGKS